MTSSQINRRLYIQVSFEVIGFHNYPDAPIKVEYLKSYHRHKFGFVVTIEVTEPNREIEFHAVKRRLLKHYGNGDEVNFGENSCEMIANYLITDLIGWFGYKRYYKVSVSEDGENAGIAELTC